MVNVGLIVPKVVGGNVIVGPMVNVGPVVMVGVGKVPNVGEMVMIVNVGPVVVDVVVGLLVVEVDGVVVDVVVGVDDGGVVGPFVVGDAVVEVTELDVTELDVVGSTKLVVDCWVEGAAGLVDEVASMPAGVSASLFAAPPVAPEGLSTT